MRTLAVGIVVTFGAHRLFLFWGVDDLSIVLSRQRMQPTPDFSHTSPCATDRSGDTVVVVLVGSSSPGAACVEARGALVGSAKK